MGGLIFRVCVMWQRDLGFREVVALQVAQNHLDLNTKHTQKEAEVYKSIT